MNLGAEIDEFPVEKLEQRPLLSSMLLRSQQSLSREK